MQKGREDPPSARLNVQGKIPVSRILFTSSVATGFQIIPYQKDRTGDKNRRISTHSDSDQQRKSEIMDNAATEQE